MAIVWDEPKRETNFARHGFDFADFDASFDGETALYLPTKPSRTGRSRYLVIGEWNDVTVVAAIVSLLGPRLSRSSAFAPQAPRSGKPMSATDRNPDPPTSGYTQEDWDAVSSPELTDEELARLRPATEMPREVFEALPKNRGGRPKSNARKVPVTIRVDPDVLEAYRATGAGWQTRMHEAITSGAPGSLATSRRS